MDGNIECALLYWTSLRNWNVFTVRGGVPREKHQTILNSGLVW